LEKIPGISESDIPRHKQAADFYSRTGRKSDSDHFGRRQTSDKTKTNCGALLVCQKKRA